MDPTKTLYFLVGPTAVGKTRFALEWAEAQGAEILSCDAFCVYKGMDIGTAKPTAEEQGRVPHHGIDLVDVDTLYSVADYTAEARAVVADVLSRGRDLLIAGGSGFYLKSFFAPVVDKIHVSPEIRERAGWIFETGGLEGAVDELRALNPAGLGDLDTKNPRRVARALERCLASGRSLAEQAEAFSRQGTPFDGFRRRVCLLERDTAELDRRAEARARAMLAEGLVEEVARLRGEGIEGNPSASKAIGYRETLRCLNGEYAEDELLAAITRNTRRLVRKQRTWFRTQIPVDRRVDAAKVSAAELFA
ncbi:MAG: tRNA (adenosine(37)-N6)-dimethylallyltransferase MiaA [Opitutales bacterium]|nr:tRNA (adenosine(37)-N6)-dimethylallyltransferase MiaA [Opitutales bacterium]